MLACWTEESVTRLAAGRVAEMLDALLSPEAANAVGSTKAFGAFPSIRRSSPSDIPESSNVFPSVRRSIPNDNMTDGSKSAEPAVGSTSSGSCQPSMQSRRESPSYTLVNDPMSGMRSSRSSSCRTLTEAAPSVPLSELPAGQIEPAYVEMLDSIELVESAGNNNTKMLGSTEAAGFAEATHLSYGTDTATLAGITEALPTSIKLLTTAAIISAESSFV